MSSFGPSAQAVPAMDMLSALESEMAPWFDDDWNRYTLKTSTLLTLAMGGIAIIALGLWVAVLLVSRH